MDTDITVAIIAGFVTVWAAIIKSGFEEWKRRRELKRANKIRNEKLIALAFEKWEHAYDKQIEYLQAFAVRSGDVDEIKILVPKLRMQEIVHSY